MNGAIFGDDTSVDASAYDEDGRLVPTGSPSGSTASSGPSGSKERLVQVDAPAPGATWRAVDLSDTLAGLLDGTLERLRPVVGTRDDGAALFYRGKVNGIAGASGSGKSWTALLCCAQSLAAGEHVVYVDLEDGAAGIVERLVLLGVPPEVILERFHYVHPDEPYGMLAAVELSALVERVAAALVVVDSTGESLALDGAKPNDDDDVARWFRRLPTRLARMGPAVLVLDHVAKAEDGGLWPIGSQRKRAAISGAQYMQTTVCPFDRTTPGWAKLVCAKDRHGNYRQGVVVAQLHVDPEAEVHVSLRVPAETSERSGGRWRPTALMERIAQAIGDEDEPLSFRGLDERVSGKADHKRTALRVLVDEGHVVVSDGPRNAKLHTLVKPYTQRTDPASDLYVGPGHTRPSPDRVSVSVSLERDTGHTHSTVSGTQSGHGGDTVPRSGCRTCENPLHEGRCVRCEIEGRVS